MIDLSLMFVGGLLGSGHCIGMCGAFAVAIGWPAERPVHNLFRQSVYSLGRLSSYVFLGAVAGFAGERLTLSTCPRTIPVFVAGVVCCWFLDQECQHGKEAGASVWVPCVSGRK
jgi:uncharacterized protein